MNPQLKQSNRPYYSLDPADDFKELQSIFSVAKNHTQRGELVINKPKNFMLGHQDHLQQKSFLINDLKYISIASEEEQRSRENKRIKEEAKKRLQNSV